ncbi:MAG: PAS domain S-box protein [Desulfobulbaceae bacterium]
MRNSAAISKTAKGSTALIVVLLSGSLTAGLGAAALFGWAQGNPLLAAFAPGLIPMAPSTALLFVLYGVGLIVFALVPASSRADGLGMLLSSAAAILSLVILVLSARGIYPEIELLSFPIAETLDGVPLGHMSPLTAFSFLLAGLSCIGLFSSSRFGRWSANGAFGLAFLLVLISFVLLLGYGAGLPLLYESGLIPPAFSTSLAGMSLGIGLLASAARRLNTPVLVDDASLSWTASVSTMIFVLMATGIITTGYLYSRHFQKKHRIEVEHQLSAIVDLKVAELKHWRQERLRDAAYFYGNADFAVLVSSYFDDPGNTEVRNRLQSWLRKIQQSFHYSRVCLHDGDGRTRLSFPAAERADDEQFSVSVLNTIRTGLIAFEDLYRNQQDGRIYLNVLVPIIPGGKQGNRVIGVLAFHLDPHEFLYPLLNFWPTPSKTAETLMVRRDGPDALFLNELRYQNDSALNLRIPLAREEVPAVRAVLGLTGITEGMDYRDVPALAALQAVPDSPWFLVARMDISEADAPVKERRWVVISLTGALLVGAACGLGLLWRLQQVAYYRVRYEAAETLRASEEKYRTLAENIPQGIFTKDRNSVYLFANENFARDLGMTADELVGKTDYDLFPRELADKYRTDDGRILASGHAESIEEPSVLRGGAKVWVHMVKTPIRDKDGNLVGILGVYSDITERKMAEEALRDNETFIKLVLDNLPVGIAVNSADPPVVFSYMNDNFPKLYRTTRDQLADPDAFWGVVYEDPDFREQMRAKVLDDVASGDPERMHWIDVPITRNGQETTYVTAHNIQIPGKPLMISTVWDVTQRKQAEEEIVTLNSRLQHLISAIQELASARTLEGVQRIVVTSARKLGGADGATMVFRDGEFCYYAEEDGIGPLWKGKRFPLASCISGWVMLNRTPAIVEDIFADERISVDAYRPTVVKSLVMVPVNTTEPVAVIGNYWSRTHRPAPIEVQLLQILADAAARAVENVLLLDELEERVRVRTEQFEAANKELEAFSYSVSHDLRAPLRAVDGYARILLDDFAPRLDAEGKRVCTVISESARAMGRLIDDLLAFSRVGRSSMQHAAIDMATMVRSVFADAVTAEERARIDFRVGYLPAAVGDPNLIRQVWINLLANSVKFSAKKQLAVIEVEGRQQGSEIVYSVRDNGAGFDMRYADKLFGVFQRLHSTREFAGTGVGLAIVQRIVARHNGRIWAEGAPGKGATFYFTLNQGE